MVLRRKNRPAGASARPPKTTPAATEARRARFVAEYLANPNGTRAAINAGYAEKGAHVTGSRLLRDPNVRAAIEAGQAKVRDKLVDRYEVSADRITRELAKLAFASMADYGRVNATGGFDLDLTETTEAAFAAIHTVKSRQVGVAKIGEEVFPLVQTEVRLADKRAALVDLGKITGLFKDGVDVTIPVRFVVERTERSKPQEQDA